MRHMLLVRRATGLQANLFQLVQQRLHFLGLPDGLAKALDIGHKAMALGDIGGHLGLELAVAHKSDHGMHMLSLNTQQLLQSLGVLEVLAQRVLELAAFFVDLLRPVTLLLRAKNPALIVLGFQHKHAKGRKDQMVNLRAAILGAQGDIVQIHIDQRIELLANGVLHRPLAPPALEARRTSNAHQHRNKQRQPQINKKAIKGHCKNLIH